MSNCTFLSLISFDNFLKDVWHCMILKGGAEKNPNIYGSKRKKTDFFCAVQKFEHIFTFKVK